MQRLHEAECEQSTLNQTNNFAGVAENEILLFRNQLKVIFFFIILLCETQFISSKDSKCKSSTSSTNG